MQAVVQHRYGGSEQLTLIDIAEPVLGEGKLLVEVRAAGVDRGTWHLMTGLPLVSRTFALHEAAKAIDHVADGHASPAGEQDADREADVSR